jgi:hypothetical protein
MHLIQLATAGGRGACFLLRKGNWAIGHYAATCAFSLTRLNDQPKPRFARNQKRALRNQSRAAREIKGALRASFSYTIKYFFRACNQNFSRFARLIKAAHNKRLGVTGW